MTEQLVSKLAVIDDLTVVTNSTAIARVISSANESAQVYLLGGAYNEDNRQTCGMMAIRQLSEFHGNLSILTVGAIAAGVGVMDYNAAEAEMAAAMIAHSDRTVILADASKFDRVAPFVVASFDSVDSLVCDMPPVAALATSLQQAGVEVIN